jgi:hypothetical protein
MPLVTQPPAKHTTGEAQAGGIPSPIDQLAYCSIATPSVQALCMADLVAAAAHGDAVGITGILMWEGRLMIHWLEGPSYALDAFWAHMESDPRQHCLVPLLRKRGANQRLFTTWKMQPTSRNEMMAIVREAKEQASRSDDPQALQWQHAISTLSILLDSELTALYAQAAAAPKIQESAA